MVNNLNGRILLSSVRGSLSRQMEAREKKLYGWNVSGKNSTFFFKKRTLPNTVWGILQKAPFIEAEGNPPPPREELEPESHPVSSPQWTVGASRLRASFQMERKGDAGKQDSS